MTEETTAEIEIVDVTQLPVTSGKRAGRMDYIFTVRLPNDRVYFIRVPAEEVNLKDEELTNKVLQSYLKEQIGHMLRWIGKKVKVSL